MRQQAVALRVAHPERIRVVVSRGLSAYTVGSVKLPGGAVIALPRLSVCAEYSFFHAYGKMLIVYFHLDY